MGGWRYWTRNGRFYVSMATDMNWFRIEVGSVSFTVARRHKPGEDK